MAYNFCETTSYWLLQSLDISDAQVTVTADINVHFIALLSYRLLCVTLTCVAFAVQPSRRLHVEKSFSCFKRFVKTHHVVTRHLHWEEEQRDDRQHTHLCKQHMLPEERLHDQTSIIQSKRNDSAGRRLNYNSTAQQTQLFWNVHFLVWEQSDPPFLFPVMKFKWQTSLLPAEGSLLLSYTTAAQWTVTMKWKLIQVTQHLSKVQKVKWKIYLYIVIL